MKKIQAPRGHEQARRYLDSNLISLGALGDPFRFLDALDETRLRQSLAYIRPERLALLCLVRRPSQLARVWNSLPKPHLMKAASGLRHFSRLSKNVLIHQIRHLSRELRHAANRSLTTPQPPPFGDKVNSTNAVEAEALVRILSCLEGERENRLRRFLEAESDLNLPTQEIRQSVLDLMD